MKKALIITAIVAAGAGAYVFNQQGASSAYNVLNYVPADTPLFAAQLEPFPIKNYIKSAPQMVDPSNQETLDELYDPANPGINFLLSLTKAYQAGLTDADLFVNTFGLADDIRVYSYTLGMLPVFKVEVANEQAIWDLLDKTELETGFVHTKGTLKELQYRAYPFTDETAPFNAELIVAVNNGFLTVTLNSAYNDQALLENALGLTEVENALADSPMLTDIIKKHSFTDSSVAFVNHIELMKGLTTSDGNLLAKQITNIDQDLNEQSPLAEIRTEQCSTELLSIANNWPRTVMGYTQVDISAQESTIAMSAIVESNNQTILTALSAIRGFIPQYTNDIDNNVFTMALGFDVSQLATGLNSIWGDLQTPSYTCQPLAEVQAMIAQSGDSIAMVGMGANMANGVQGVSLGLLDYAISQIDQNPQLDSLDALVSVSAQSPAQLFNYAKMMLPELQQVELTEGGEPIELSSLLPIPSELNIAPKLAIKGKHLVVYNGKKGEAAANALTSEALAKNGLYDIGFDFKKMITPIITAAELSGEVIPEEAMFLTEYDARMQMSFDINEQGLILKSKINNKAPQ